MTHRIGLFTQRQKTKSGQPSTVATYVDVADAAQLVSKLNELGAARAGLMRRDRDGTTHLEGDMFTPPQLGKLQFTWLTDKPTEFQTRGLFYD